MILAIHYSKTLADLQEKFNECFPHLKLEFYAHPHHWQQLSQEREHLDPATKVGDLNLKNENGVLEIKSSYQIGRVEQDFQKDFGLNVQVFRKEDGNWVQTSNDDSLLLKMLPEPTPAAPVSMPKTDEEEDPEWTALSL